MRADRLVATMLLLQARGRLTAAEIAAELDVSLKTARRDLEALAMAGVPVYAQPGRGGGWSLLGGGKTDLSGLTAAEARALFLVAGPSATVAPAAKAALRKLVRALPEPFRADAEAAAAAVVVDPARWGGRAATTPAHLDVLQRAIVDGVQVRLRYTDRAGRETERVVHPLGLVRKGLTWYLVANTDAGLRTFHVARVIAAAVTDAPVDRPAGFDLDAEWRSQVASFEGSQPRIAVLLRVPAAAVPWLEAQFGDAVTTASADAADGHAHVHIAATSADAAAQGLAGWGGQVEVVEPAEVRALLARIGAELVKQYGNVVPVPAGADRSHEPGIGTRPVRSATSTSRETRS